MAAADRHVYDHRFSGKLRSARKHSAHKQIFLRCKSQHDARPRFRRRNIGRIRRWGGRHWDGGPALDHVRIVGSTASAGTASHWRLAKTASTSTGAAGTTAEIRDLQNRRLIKVNGKAFIIAVCDR